MIVFKHIVMPTGNSSQGPGLTSVNNDFTVDYHIYKFFCSNPKFSVDIMRTRKLIVYKFFSF